MPIHKTESEIIKKINHFLAKANDPQSSESEREQALAHASSLMAKHRIDEALLDASRTVGEQSIITGYEFQLFADPNAEWAEQMITLLYEIARTNNCRVARYVGNRVAVLVGKQQDVDWAHTIWVGTVMQLASKIHPEWSDSLPLGHNVMAFKHAGFSWRDIWIYAHGHYQTRGEEEYDPKRSHYLMTEYKRACRATDTEPIGVQSFRAYRISFVDGFVRTVARRLERMRNDQAEASTANQAGALALRNVSADVDEEFYRRFPSMRPMTEEELERQMARMKQDDENFLDSLSPTERAKVLKEREVEKRKAARVSNKYWEEQFRLRSHTVGAKAGGEAGAMVDLSRGGKMDSPEGKKEIV